MSKKTEPTARDEILEFVRNRPGTHYRGIVAEMPFANGTIQLHMRNLVKESLVKIEPIRGTHCYFAAEYELTDRDRMKLRPSEVELLRELDMKPKPLHKIAEALNVSRQTVRSRIDQLIAYNLVQSERRMWKITELGLIVRGDNPG